jgi:thiol oxidase
MFHMLTMTAPMAGLSANEITGAIRTFVDHFFGCEHCRNHFLGMYDACEYQRCESDHIENAQLWLWRLHNAVNVRTAFEALQDEVSSKAGSKGGELVEGLVDLDPTWALWPTETDCPQCRKVSTGGGGSGASRGSIGRQHSTVEWDEKEVLNHLKRAYDIGLWEGNKISTMVKEAERSKESFMEVFTW